MERVAPVALAAQIVPVVPAVQTVRIAPFDPVAQEMAVVAVAHRETRVDCQRMHSVGLYQKIVAAAFLDMTVVAEIQGMIAVAETAAAPVAHMAVGDFVDIPAAHMAADHPA